MKALMCSLAAVLSMALNSAVFAADDQITGTVVSVDVGYMEIDEGKHDGGTNFGVFVADWGPLYKPKVGERVKVHIHLSGRGKVYADKIEKLGPAEGGSKKK